MATKQAGKPLTAAFVRSVRKPGRYGDGRGSYGVSILVRVTKSGRVSKTFSQRVRIDGRPVMIGLGPYPLVTLAEARKQAVANARMLRKGQDPRKGKNVPTFEEAADQVIRIRAKGWKPGSPTEADWRATFATYAFPTIGAKPINAITSGDVSRVLLPVWHSKPEVAKRLRTRTTAVMQWGIGQGWTTADPVPVAVVGLPPRPNGRRKHYRALAHGDVSGAIATVRAARVSMSTANLFEFLALTAVRSAEARGATWGEIDRAARVWTVPASRMKAGAEHRVPMSTAALRVLDRAAIVSDPGDPDALIFPGRSGRAMSHATMPKMLKTVGVPATVHGLRSSFRSWCADQGIVREVAEACLSHATGTATERSYQRSDMLERRRELMEAWGTYLAT